MAHHDVPNDTDDFDKSFEPQGSLVLTIGYLLVFAAAWGLVYFNDLLARR